jgi:dTDP-4-dehydrorhamnose reductase
VAQLVQTDDLGRTFSTPALADRAEHENERRWLTFDLLCGRVDRDHPWWNILREHGIRQRHLEMFLEADCAPDIIGINHYLTSERFLDARLARYPEHFWGGGGSERYADVEAVRVPRPGGELGPAARLTEVWDRYRLPIAVTEAHHGCTRDEQLRWLVEVWRAAEMLRGRGADIRAVTVWAMFGAVDWNSLLTRENACYEPGAFDVRGPAPRPTALAHAAAALATSGRLDHPVLDRPGWWRREDRFYRPVKPRRRIAAANAPRPLLIVGAGTPASEAFSRVAAIRGLDHEVAPARELASGTAFENLMERLQPWAVIDSQAVAPERLLRFCDERGLPYLALSSASVFDGRLGRAYLEDDVPSRSGLQSAGETRIATSCPAALVVRAGPLFGPWDDGNFAWQMLHALSSGRMARVEAEIVSPSYLPDLVHIALDLLIDGEQGLWHLPNPGQASWAELAAMLAGRADLPAPAYLPSRGRKLRNSALHSRRGALLPPLASALDRFVRDCEVDWAPRPAALRVAAE